MKNKAKLILSLFIVLSLSSVKTSAQDTSEDTSNNLKEYGKRLELTDTQKDQFSKIILKYNLLLENHSSSNKTIEKGKNNNLFNQLLKNEISEIYEILSPSQFSIYKKIRPVIEPQKVFITN